MKSSDQPIEEAANTGPDGPTRQPDDAIIVLLVEDDDLVLEVASVVLKQQGYVVLEARDGDEAVQVMKDYAGRSIDLLLTDYFMPSISGMELAKTFKEHHTNARVLYMSGYPRGEVFGEGDLGPLDGFIQKPFTPSGLTEHVKETVDRPSPKSE